MTRQKPDSLLGSVSNLSLRSAAMASTSSPPLGADEPQTAESRRFVFAGMADRPAADNLVCVGCALLLCPEERALVTVAPDVKHCELCALGEARPDVFTQPFLDFMTRNPTVFHAVNYFEKMLERMGYKQVRWLMQQPATYVDAACSSAEALC